MPTKRLVLGVPLISSTAVAAGTIWGIPRDRVFAVIREDAQLAVDYIGVLQLATGSESGRPCASASATPTRRPSSGSTTCRSPEPGGVNATGPAPSRVWPGPNEGPERRGAHSLRSPRHQGLRRRARNHHSHRITFNARN